MVDQLSPANTCRVCGASLNQNRVSTESTENLCDVCNQNKAILWNPAESHATGAPYPYDQYQETQPPPALDPDRPRWGAGTGIATLLFSFAAIAIVPIVVVIIWYVFDKQRGVPVPDPTDRQGILDWVMSPRLLLVQVYSTLAAHLVTIVFCWAVVTRLRTQPFLKSLGWHWAGRSALYWWLISFGVFALVIAADQFFVRVLPQSETSFDKLLQASPQVRIAVALLATVSAPFVEEVIYRGLLYSGLRKSLGVAATVITVTVLFAGVHALQYWGAWASMAGLTMLSLILTLVRAKTKSILPCVVIHFVNNAIASVLILWQGGQPSVQPEGSVCEVIGRAVWMLFVKF
jgi:membrane protease YdiL (CAAX protease family)